MARLTLRQKVGQVWTMIQRGSDHPIVQRLAVRIIEKTVLGGERSYFGEWRSLHDWARSNIDYVPQRPGRDRFQEAEETLALGKGDCEDFTILLGAMGQHLGLPSKVRVASPDGLRWRHVYLMGGYPPRRPRSWVAVDASSQTKPIGWQNVVKYRYWKDFFPRTYSL